MRATIVLGFLFGLGLVASIAPSVSADYVCHGNAAVGECEGEWTEGPGCEPSKPGASYGTRGTEASAHAGPASVDAAGMDHCSLRDGQQYDSPEIDAGVTAVRSEELVWQDHHAAGYHECSMSISPGSLGGSCPAGIPPPDPGWGAVLP